MPGPLKAPKSLPRAVVDEDPGKRDARGQQRTAGGNFRRPGCDDEREHRTSGTSPARRGVWTVAVTITDPAVFEGRRPGGPSGHSPASDSTRTRPALSRRKQTRRRALRAGGRARPAERRRPPGGAAVAFPVRRSVADRADPYRSAPCPPSGNTAVWNSWSQIVSAKPRLTSWGPSSLWWMRWKFGLTTIRPNGPKPSRVFEWAKATIPP